MLTREQCKELSQRVIEASKADEVYISLGSVNKTHLRYANNMPTTSGHTDDVELFVKSSFGRRSAGSRINQLDDASLKRVVQRSEDLARVAPMDPEHMPVLGPQTYAPVAAFHPSSPEETAKRMARGTAICIDKASKRNLQAAGFTSAASRASCIATSKGMFGYHRSSGVSFSQTVRTKDGRGSGWAAQVGDKMDDIAYGRAADTAIDKAVRSVAPKPLAPGKYVTILEPACVANLVWLFVRSLWARSADEGRSYFSAKDGKNRLGEKIFGDDVDIWSDPTDPRDPGWPWGMDGLPQERRKWVERGTLTNLAYTRHWARKQKKQAVPPPSNVIMNGDKGSLSELIASTKKGLLVTSLWYIRSVDPKTMLHTGLTRDGVYWIEGGKISHPVTNFRWNESPIRVLKNIEAMTASARVAGRSARSAVVPALRVKEFELSSVSDAV